MFQENANLDSSDQQLMEDGTLGFLADLTLRLQRCLSR